MSHTLKVITTFSILLFFGLAGGETTSVFVDLSLQLHQYFSHELLGAFGVGFKRLVSVLEVC